MALQAQLERLIEKNYYLHQSARDAYRSYLLAYNSHAHKDAFNVHTLDLKVGVGSSMAEAVARALHVCTGVHPRQPAWYICAVGLGSSMSCHAGWGMTAAQGSANALCV